MFIFFLHPLSVAHEQYTEQIQQSFENADITLSTITLLSPEVQNQLSNFSTKSKDFDSTAITQQVGTIPGLACLCRFIVITRVCVCVCV